MNSPNLKYSADYIHDGTGFVRGRVLVTDRQGTVIDLVEESGAGEGVRHIDGVLCPGFVNAHCHLELSHMKGRIPEHTGLVDFLLAVVSGRSFPEDQIAEAAHRAESSMLEEGIVAVGDISNTALTAPLKARGRLYYHTFVETLGVQDADAGARLEGALATREAFSALGLRASVVPHAPYSVSGALMRAIDRLDSGHMLSIHNQESDEENRLFQGKPSGLERLYRAIGQQPLALSPARQSSLRAWLPRFTRRQPILAVHNTYCSGDDIRFAAASDHPFYWCLCPGANLYIENRLPPVESLVSAQAAICLGTDSLASNHSLSILEEIRHLGRGFGELTLETLLGWATREGAAALAIGDRFGRLTLGTRPGILQLHPVSGTPDLPRVTPLTRVLRIK